MNIPMALVYMFLTGFGTMILLIIYCKVKEYTREDVSDMFPLALLSVFSVACMGVGVFFGVLKVFVAWMT